MTDVERLQALFDEAIRVLNRRTGLRWHDAIVSRVEAGVRSERCGECGGHGTVNRFGPLSGDWTERCDVCDGSGEVLVPMDGLGRVEPAG